MVGLKGKKRAAPDLDGRTFRWIVFPQNDGYLAECIDLNLLVWREDLDSALYELQEVFAAS